MKKKKKRKPTIHYINLNHGLKDEHSVYPFFSSLTRSIIFFLTVNNTEDDSGNLAIVKKQINKDIDKHRFSKEIERNKIPCTLGK